MPRNWDTEMECSAIDETGIAAIKTMIRRLRMFQTISMSKYREGEERGLSQVLMLRQIKINRPLGVY
jgi:hypothetical protein